MVQECSVFNGQLDRVSFHMRLTGDNAASPLIIEGDTTWVIPKVLFKEIFLPSDEMKHPLPTHPLAGMLLGKVLATTQACLFWKDTQRRFLGANKAFLDYYGFDSVEVILGKTDEEMGWHPDPTPYENDEKLILEQGISTMRVPGICLSHGEARNIVASKSPLYENGKIIGLVGSFEDVTNETRQREEIANLNEKLRLSLANEKRANQAKSDFLARMSHDMRTPLTTIQGLTDVANETVTDPTALDYFSKIRSSSDYLLSMLNDVLEVEKLSQQAWVTMPQVIAGDDIFQMVETAIRPRAEKKGLDFGFNVPIGFRYELFYVDPLPVQRIALNLLSNALQFTDQGGKVSLTLLANPGDQHDNPLPSFKMLIQDSGIGMSEDFQKHMFEAFTKANPESDKGTGLGLIISKMLANSIGGDLSCESHLGEGTVFTLSFRLPKASALQAENYRKEHHLINPKETRFRGTVLLCEDNEINAEIISLLLVHRGLTVDHAYNGKEGLELFHRNKYALILMDIRMPVMDGLSAAEAIRKEDKTIPIIALSANSFNEDIRQSLAAGMNEHLAKPIDTQRLFEVLSKYLPSDTN
jgi:PAS domain S-box-containing protein